MKSFRVLSAGNGNFYVDGPTNDGRGIFNKWFPTRAAADRALVAYLKRNRVTFAGNPVPGRANSRARPVHRGSATGRPYIIKEGRKIYYATVEAAARAAQRLANALGRAVPVKRDAKRPRRRV